MRSCVVYAKEGDEFRATIGRWEERQMKAYLIAVETVQDEAMFAEYRKQVVGTVGPFGGQFIARGGKLTVLEGEWQHPRTVIIEFPTRRVCRSLV